GTLLVRWWAPSCSAPPARCSSCFRRRAGSCRTSSSWRCPTSWCSYCSLPHEDVLVLPPHWEAWHDAGGGTRCRHAFAATCRYEPRNQQVAFALLQRTIQRPGDTRSSSEKVMLVP